MLLAFSRNYYPCNYPKSGQKPHDAGQVKERQPGKLKGYTRAVLSYSYEISPWRMA
jgi:hypothetical protein